jgi:hypothetical protein
MWPYCTLFLLIQVSVLLPSHDTHKRLFLRRGGRRNKHTVAAPPGQVKGDGDPRLMGFHTGQRYTPFPRAACSPARHRERNANCLAARPLWRGRPPSGVALEHQALVTAALPRLGRNCFHLPCQFGQAGGGFSHLSKSGGAPLPLRANLGLLAGEWNRSLFSLALS